MRGKTTILRLVGVLGLIIILVSCAPSKYELENQLSQNCKTTQLAGEYIVQWTSGKIEKIKAEDDVDFLNRVQQKELLNQTDFLKWSGRNFILKSSSLKHKASTNLVALPKNIPDMDTPPPVNSFGFTKNNTSWALAQLGAPELWDKNILGQGRVSAIIDTGLNLELKSAFEGRIHENGDLGQDEDQNGFKGDQNGWDFTTHSPLQKDWLGHGTNIASLIASNHKLYKISVAPESKIIPVAYTQSETGTLDQALKAINYSYKRGAQLINLSWSGESCSRGLELTLKSIAQKNVLFFTSSGNEGLDLDSTPRFPASLKIPGLLTIGSINQKDKVAAFSNFGLSVDLLAPGDRVPVINGTGLVAPFSRGTSLSTPLSLGLAALIWSAFPGAPSHMVEQALLESARNKRLQATDALTRLNELMIHSDINL